MKHLKFEDLLLFEDDDIMAINKPYDISTLDDRDATRTNVLKLAKSYCADAQVCHRLDRETSGVMLIAKNPESYRHMSLQFENRNVTKIYHAVIQSIEKLQHKEVDLPILPLKDGVVKIDPAGKPAFTVFNTLEVYFKHSLIACMPITGRMHQIRIHLSAIGCPIVADKLYGGKEVFLSHMKRDFKLKKFTDEQPLIKRVALHAQSITFSNLQGKETTITAPYPKDFAVLIKQLEKNI